MRNWLDVIFWVLEFFLGVGFRMDRTYIIARICNFLFTLNYLSDISFFWSLLLKKFKWDNLFFKILMIYLLYFILNLMFEVIYFLFWVDKFIRDLLSFFKLSNRLFRNININLYGLSKFIWKLVSFHILFKTNRLSLVHILYLSAENLFSLTFL